MEVRFYGKVPGTIGKRTYFDLIIVPTSRGFLCLKHILLWCFGIPTKYKKQVL